MRRVVSSLLLILLSVGSSAFGVQLNESFEGGIPENWTVIDNDNDGYTFTSPAQYAINGHKEYAAGMGCKDDYLITPMLNVTEDNSSFNFKAAVESAGKKYSFKVMISNTDPEISSFSLLEDFPEYDTDNWNDGEKSIDLSSYIGENVYLAFYIYDSSSQYYSFGFDDVSGPEIYTPDYNFSVNNYNGDIVGPIGNSTFHCIEIENKGNLEDTYNLSISEPGNWGYSIVDKTNLMPINTITISPQDKDTIFVKTEIPETASNEDEDMATVQFQSLGLSSIIKSVELKTFAIELITNFPYEEGFENSLNSPLPFGMKVEDKDEDGKTWIGSSVMPHTGDKYATLEYNSSTGNNDWLFTPPIQLEADKNYRLSFYIKGGSEYSSKKFMVKYGSSQSSNSMMEMPIYINETLQFLSYQKVDAVFSPTEDNIFYIGFYGYEGAGYTPISLDDIKLEIQSENDLMVSSIIKDDLLHYDGDEVTFKAFIYNNGSEVQTNKTVTFKANGVTFAEKNIESISVNDTIEVEATWNSYAGSLINIEARVEDDDFNSNNSYSITTDIYQEGYLVESFEGEEFPPLEWNIIGESGNSWSLNGDEGYQGDKSAIINRDSENVSHSRLVTPKLIIKEGSSFSFYAKRGVSETSLLSIEYSEDGAQFTQISAISLEEDYKRFDIDLSSLAGNNYYISLNGEVSTDYNQFVSIDMVSGPEVFTSDEPIFEMTPEIAEYQFTETTIGDSSDVLEIKVRNKGGSIMVFNSGDIALNGTNSNQFSMEEINFPVELSYNQSIYIHLTFNPSEIGNKSAELVINDNLSKEVHTVELSGEAKPGAPITVYPVNNGNNIPVDGTLEWINGEGTEKVDLYFDTVNPPVVKVLDNVDPVNQYTFDPQLDNSTRYYWKVVNRGYDNGETFETSGEVNSFFTELPGSMIQIGFDEITDAGLPIDLYYGYTYSQTIYKQSEINVSEKKISKIFYYYAGNSAVAEDIAIYMAHTSLNVFETADWIPYEDLTLVYEGVLNTSGNDGWIEITLDTPFDYNNTDNLVIAVDENSSTYYNQTDAFYCSSDMSNGYRSMIYRSDSVNPDPQYPPTAIRRSTYPNIRLDFEEVATTPVASFNMESIDYGNVQVGAYVSKELIITNDGGENLIISDITIEGDEEFTFTPSYNGDITIEPGNSYSLSVNFQPNDQGVKTGNLKIIDNISKQENIIPLSGKAVYSSPSFLVGEVNENENVELSWHAPYPLDFMPYLTEDFEGESFPPAGWKVRYSETLGDSLTEPYYNSWEVCTPDYHSGIGNDYIHSGNQSAVIWHNAPGFNYLITPRLTISDGSFLNFYLYYKNGGFGGNTKFYVMAKKSDGTFDSLLSYNGGASNLMEEQITIDLSQYDGTEVEIAFVYENNNSYELAIDDFFFTSPTKLAKRNRDIVFPTGYNVYRDGNKINSEPVVEKSYVDSLLSEEGVYEYRVSAVYDEFESELSDYILVSLDKEELYAPVNLTAEVRVDSVLLNWYSPGEVQEFVNENFESPIFPDNGWDLKFDLDGTGNSLTDPETDKTWFDFTPKDGSETMIYEGYRSAAIRPNCEGFHWLLSPYINVEDGDNLNFYIHFRTNPVNDMTTLFHLKLLVDGEWVNIMSTDENSQNNEYETPLNFDLSEYSGKIVRAAFVYEGNNAYIVAIDNVTMGSRKNKQSVNKRSLLGYNVYRNGSKINDELVTNENYLDIVESKENISYFVKAVYNMGESEESNTVSVSPVSVEENLPLKTALYNNYPNPFNPVTTINYSLLKEGLVNLSVYNVKGELVSTILNERVKAGFHSINWDGKNNSSGVYYLVMKSGHFNSLKKMVLVK